MPSGPGAPAEGRPRAALHPAAGRAVPRLCPRGAPAQPGARRRLSGHGGLAGLPQVAAAAAGRGRGGRRAERAGARRGAGFPAAPAGGMREAGKPADGRARFLAGTCSRAAIRKGSRWSGGRSSRSRCSTCCRPMARTGAAAASPVLRIAPSEVHSTADALERVTRDAGRHDRNGAASWPAFPGEAGGRAGLPLGGGVHFCREPGARARGAPGAAPGRAISARCSCADAPMRPPWFGSPDMDHDLRLIEAILFASPAAVAERGLADRLPEGADVPAAAGRARRRLPRPGHPARPRRGRLDVPDGRGPGQPSAAREAGSRASSRAPAVETLAAIAYTSGDPRRGRTDPRRRGKPRNVRHPARSGLDPPGRPARRPWRRRSRGGTTAGFLEHFAWRTSPTCRGSTSSRPPG